MSKQRPRTADAISRLLLVAAVLSFAFLAAAWGCKRDSRMVGRNAMIFRDEVQTRINVISAELAGWMAKKNRSKVESYMESCCLASNPGGKVDLLFLAVLDSHGVMVATRAEKELSGAHNFGNYHVVSDAIRKRRPFQSSLYLHGNRKVYIVSSPLFHGKEVVGVLIIGIDSEELNQSGITETEFMSLVFNAPRSGIQ